MLKGGFNIYKVSIFNNNTETVINYPTANKDAPHLLSLDHQEKLSQVDNLSVDIPYMNPGYNFLEGLKTKIKIYNRDNTVKFTGRVLTVSNEMKSKGTFIKEFICESALGYLNDSIVSRQTLTNQTPEQILNTLLNSHNSQVNDPSRTIRIGNVELTQPITPSFNYETTLNAIIKNLVNVLGGDLSIRETDGILYLDFLKAQGGNNGVKIQLGRNQQSLVVKYDPTSIVTRLICLGYGEGINQLDITKVNSGLNYIQDSNAIANYGIIVGTATNKDIQNAEMLEVWGQTQLSQNVQPLMRTECSMLDLSTIGLDKPLDLGDTAEIINTIMNFDVFARVVEKETDYINSPHNPKLAIDTRPIRLSDQIVNLKQRANSLENAPQGNTCIFPLVKAENADASHPITFDLDIPQEAININRVYINLHGRKYRAYEKGLSAAAQQTGTSGSGGGSEQTSSSGGGGTQTSDISSGLDTVMVKTWRYVPAATQAGQYSISVDNGYIDVWPLSHTHDINHAHTVNIPPHTHDVTIPDHTHSVTIPAHNHDIEYGIFEDTQPKNCKVSVNSTDIGVTYGDGSSDFDEYNIDITSKVTTGNNKIVISTDTLGRIEATIYCQIFIQSK